MVLREVITQVIRTVVGADGSGPWTLRLTIGLVDDRPAVIGVELWAVDPSRVRDALPNAAMNPWFVAEGDFTSPITAAGLRLPIGRMLNEWATSTRRSARRYGRGVAQRAAHPQHDQFTPEALEHEQRLKRVAEYFAGEVAAMSPKGGRRRGRPAHDRSHFETVAGHYNAALEAGEQAPRLYVARQMSVSASTAAKWIAKCRTPEIGLLPPTSPGRSKGSSTSTREKEGKP